MILSAAVLLFVLGFIFIAIAVNIPDSVDLKYANMIGFSALGFWGLSLFLLLKNYANIISSEMNELTERMHQETDFFSTISMAENPQTLEERFIQSGFRLKNGYLHKRKFSVAKDYINYYVAIVKDENIIAYFDVLLGNMEDLLHNGSRLNKNNVVYVFFFNSHITQEEMAFLKNILVNQEVAQGLPAHFDTILPIVYDTANQQYLIRALRGRLSIKLLQIALRKFYKMINLA